MSGENQRGGVIAVDGSVTQRLTGHPIFVAIEFMHVDIARHCKSLPAIGGLMKELESPEREFESVGLTVGGVFLLRPEDAKAFVRECALPDVVQRAPAALLARLPFTHAL
jgi:hypothetical protein